MPISLPNPSPLSRLWKLDPKVVYLNHGSFGACPIAVLNYQQQLRDSLETEPVKFLTKDLWELMEQSREALASFIGAKSDNIAFVSNATEGVNTVFKSVKLSPGDEILVGSQEYDASRNSAEYCAKQARAKIVEVSIPFPIGSDDEIVERLLSGVSKRTRLLLVDHVTSPTGIIFPVKRLVDEFGRKGIDVFVDGAHAPGMIKLDLESLGAAYYAGNCHKWICSPKGAGFLYVRSDKQTELHPLNISHGYAYELTPSGKSRFRYEFDWTGTKDPSPWLCVPESINYIGRLLPGGWHEVQARNHDLACAGRKLICEALGVNVCAPDKMVGSLASILLPFPPGVGLHSTEEEPLKEVLMDKYQIEVPVFSWPGINAKILRISAQLYNSIDQYRYLAEALLSINQSQ
jgi:isopenicillin-N epimerase